MGRVRLWRAKESAKLLRCTFRVFALLNKPVAFFLFSRFLRRPRSGARTL